MGSTFSKTSGDTAPPHLEINNDTQYMAELQSYEAACQLDPNLQMFDANLQQRANKVINTLAVGVEVHTMSFESLREVTGCLLEMNQEVVKVIWECKKDIWKNHDLFDLVEEYFESSLQTLDFCTALDKCLKRTRDSQLILHVALQEYEEEIQDGVAKNKYMRTLQELRSFKAADNPFTEEFLVMFQRVYKQQVSMLQKLQLRRKKLDKKLKSLKAWRTVSNVIFVAAFASVLIFTVVAAAIAAPPVVTALAGVLSVPVSAAGKWINSLWTGYENAVKGQKEMVSSMQVGTYVAIKDLDNIHVLVEKLEIEIELFLQNAELASTEEDAVKHVIEDIKKKLHIFMETIESLSEHADKCSQDIRRARTVILQTMIKHPNNSD